MPATYDLRPILDFLSQLKENNHKSWFELHKQYYENARSAFERFINDLIDEFRAEDGLQALTAKECMARIYRDIRFSRDKSPYKTNLGALVGPGGWKGNPYGYFISLEPGGKSMVAGGLHDPTPEQLEAFRQVIKWDAKEFKKITSAPEFLKIFGNLEGERLKTAPKGYDKDHPEIDLLQLKQIIVIHPFSDKSVLGPDFKDQVVTSCRVMKPFLDYLRFRVQ
jgi:uncharacterized protein (TIGR02453 family)